MRIISETRLSEFWAKYPAAESSMRDWIKIVQPADWRSFADLRKTFNHADVYGNCVIFDIGGNKYRVIAKIEYQKHLVFIRFILTHAQYDKDKWCYDCK